MSNKNELVPIEQQYPVLGPDGAGFLEVMQENLGGEGLSPSDLEVIKVPSGSSPVFMVQTLAGEEPVKELVGIIVHTDIGRAYWSQPMGEGETQQPDCQSSDGIEGEGTPGGPCADCEFSQFGSDPDGRGQACKQVRRLFLLREDCSLPSLLRVPPTSLKAARKYLVSLGSRGVSHLGVVTRITLEKTKNPAGTEYCRLVFNPGGQLTADQAAAVRGYAAALQVGL